MNRALYTDKDLELVATLKKEGKLSLYIFLCSIKDVHKDKLVTYKQRDELHKKIKYSKSSIKKNFTKLVEAGWADKEPKGYYLKSYGKIALELGVNSQYRKFRKVRGKTTRELVARASFCYIENNLKAQQKKVLGTTHCRKNKLSDIVRCYDENVMFTVRKLSKLVGYSSAMSGTNLFKEMEYLGLIARKRVNSIVCRLDEASKYAIQENWDRLWIDYKTGMIMRREPSLIKVMVK